MKKFHFVLETVLMSITAFFAIWVCSSGDFPVVTEDSGILASFWLLILGASQVIHSLVLGIIYWNNKAIRKWIGIYWVGVGINFLILGIDDMAEYNSKDIENLTIIILPLFLATYLWYITFKFRKRNQLIAIKP